MWAITKQGLDFAGLALQKCFVNNMITSQLNRACFAFLAECLSTSSNTSPRSQRSSWVPPQWPLLPWGNSAAKKRTMNHVLWKRYHFCFHIHVLNQSGNIEYTYKCSIPSLGSKSKAWWDRIPAAIFPKPNTVACTGRYVYQLNDQYRIYLVSLIFIWSNVEIQSSATSFASGESLGLALLKDLSLPLPNHS